MFPPSRRVAWEEARELVRALREAMAADMKRAAGPGPEAEAVLRRANDEARRIVQEAEDSARRALEDGTLAHAAEQQLQQVREQAVREADETRRSADQYAMTVLERLEREVARILATVQRGKTVLSERTGGRTPASTANAARLDNGKLASV
jgi:vacuolar-type H+-ATPase subunit H